MTDKEDEVYEEISLKYRISRNHKDNTMSIKFFGFEDKEQMETFSQYIEKELLTLIAPSSNTLH